MKSALYRRVLAVALSMAMLASLVVPAAAAGKSAASAAEEWNLTPIDAGKVSPAKTGQVKGGAELQQEPYGLADILRVSIVLESDSTLKAGFEIAGVASNKQATSYRAALKKEQAAVTARIEKAIGRSVSDRKKMAENVERSLMLVTALSPKIGYDNAAKTAHKAFTEGKSLREASTEMGFLTEAEFDECFHPERMV